MPLGVEAKAFLSAPVNHVGKSAEAKYAREYAHATARVSLGAGASEKMGESVDGFPSGKLVPLGEPLCAVGSGHAAELRKRQDEFFKKIDACIIDEDSARSAGECGRVPDATSPWERKLARGTASLRTAQAAAPPSHTRVIEAAFFLCVVGYSMSKALLI